MSIPLYIHLSIHLLLSLLAGAIAWRIWKKPLLSLSGAILGGFLIDLDHFIDYFLAFGWNFNYFYFIKGYEFLKTDKMYIFFHGWEYVFVLLMLLLILKNKNAKSLCLALALALFFHLVSDVFMDKVSPKSYFVILRAEKNFDLKKIVTPEHWEKHLKYKKKINFE